MSMDATTIQGWSSHFDQLINQMRYCQILWMSHDQAALVFSPSVNVTPAITS